MPGLTIPQSFDSLWVMPVVPPESLTRRDVTLRPFSAADALAVTNYAADREALAGVWLPLDEPPSDPALWAAWFVREAMIGWSPRGGRYGGALAIDTDAASFVGWVNFVPVRDDTLELLYGVAPQHRGHGIASTSARLATDWALSVGFVAIELEIAAHHTESQRVAEKSGFRLVERFVKTVATTGQTYEDLRFTRTE